MDWDKILKTQKELEERASKNSGLVIYSQEWYDNRIIALIGELHESLEVLESFKDWKEHKGKVDTKRFKKETYIANATPLWLDSRDGKHCSNKEALHRTLVEECSDILHLLGSLFNFFDYKPMTAHPPKLVNVNLSFLTSLQGILDLGHVRTEYIVLLRNYHEELEYLHHNLFCYFYALGITEEELEDAYFYKNKVNNKRLESGY